MGRQAWTAVRARRRRIRPRSTGDAPGAVLRGEPLGNRRPVRTVLGPRAATHGDEETSDGAVTGGDKTVGCGQAYIEPSAVGRSHGPVDGCPPGPDAGAGTDDGGMDAEADRADNQGARRDGKAGAAGDAATPTGIGRAGVCTAGHTGTVRLDRRVDPDSGAGPPHGTHDGQARIVATGDAPVPDQSRLGAAAETMDSHGRWARRRRGGGRVRTGGRRGGGRGGGGAGRA